MPIHTEIISVHREQELEAWIRLGWLVIGHSWDLLGPFTILGQRARQTGM